MTTTLGLLDLRASGEHRFEMVVRADLSTQFGSLYGGGEVAASIEAAEVVAGRPVQWMTTQFIGATQPPEVVTLEVTLAAHGRATTQSQVVGTVGQRVVFVSLGAHTVRPSGNGAQFVEMPVLPAPAECAPADPFEDAPPGSFLDHIERRWALGGPAVVPPAGRVALWCRLRGGPIVSAAAIAFVADIIPLAVCHALGVPPTGTSLDNTVRIIDPEPSDWVLLEMIPEGFQRSTGHGSLRMWSEGGRLMATAQQSSIIRLDPQTTAAGDNSVTAFQ